MAKGYGADSTLVSAAFKLGQSYGPADYTKAFQMQYEGLAKAFDAKSKMFGSMAISGAKTIENIAQTAIKNKEGRDKQEDKLFDLFDAKDFDQNLNEIVTNFADGEVKSQGKNYDSKASIIPNKEIFRTDQLEFENLKAEIEQYSDKILLTKEDREKRNTAISKTLKLRETINNSRALLNSTYEKHTKGFIDLELSHESDPDAMLLYSQVMKKDGDLQDVGVRRFYKDGEVYYRYPVGMANPIMNNIQKKAKELENMSLNLDVPTSEELVKKGSEMLTGKKEIGLEVPKLKTKELELPTPKQYKIISEKNLFGGLQEVDNKTRNTLQSEVSNVITAAQEMTTGLDGSGKIVSVENYGKIEAKTIENIKSHLNESTSYRNLTNKPILIGGEEISWKDDLGDYLAIDIAIIDQEFIGSGVLTLEQLKNWDKNDNGILEQTELDKHKKAKNMLIGKLLNPTTQQEKKISVDEYSKFISSYVEQAFNDTRRRMGVASKESSINKNLIEAVDTERQIIRVGDEVFKLQKDGRYKLTEVRKKVKGGFEFFPIKGVDNPFRTKEEMKGLYGGDFSAK